MTHVTAYKMSVVLCFDRTIINGYVSIPLMGSWSRVYPMPCSSNVWPPRAWPTLVVINPYWPVVWFIQLNNESSNRNCVFLSNPVDSHYCLVLYCRIHTPAAFQGISNTIFSLVSMNSFKNPPLPLLLCQFFFFFFNQTWRTQFLSFSMGILLGPKMKTAY